MTSEGTTCKAWPSIRTDGKGLRLALQAHFEQPGLAKGKGTSMDVPFWPSDGWFGRSTLPPHIEELRLAKGILGKVVGKGQVMDAPSRRHIILASGVLCPTGRQDHRPVGEAATWLRSQGSTGSGVTQEGEEACADEQPEWQRGSEEQPAGKRRRHEALSAPGQYDV